MGISMDSGMVVFSSVWREPFPTNLIANSCLTLVRYIFAWFETAGIRIILDRCVATGLVLRSLFAA